MPHRGPRPAFGFPTPASCGRLQRATREVAVRALFGLALVAAVFGAPATATAQAPTSIMNLISSTSVDSTAEQRIARYVNWYADRLAGGGADASDAARRLLEPLKTTAASRSFRGAYASVAVPRMKGIAGDPPTPFAGVNAMIVLSKIGTESALTALIAEADVNRQDAWMIRLAAARGIKHLLKDDFNEGISDRFRLRCTRDLAAFAEREEDPRVLRYMMLSILEADEDRFDDGTRGDIHEAFATALTNVAERAVGDARFASSTGLAVAAARNAFLDLASRREVQLAFSRALAPAMIEVLAAYGAHTPADGTDANPAFGRDIDRLETALGFLVTAVNPAARIPENDASATAAWNAGDGEAFTAAVAAWRAAAQ